MSSISFYQNHPHYIYHSTRFSTANMKPIQPQTLVPDQVILSRNSYSFGPSARMVYADYKQPRNHLDVLIGPVFMPFGISCFQDDLTKLSATFRFPTDHEQLAPLLAFDNALRDRIISTQSQATWASNFTYNQDNVNRLYVPFLSADAFNQYNLRCSIRTIPETNTLKPLFLVKRKNPITQQPTIQNISNKL